MLYAIISPWLHVSSLPWDLVSLRAFGEIAYQICTVQKRFHCSQVWPFQGLFYLMFSFLLFYCFTYLLNKDVYLPLIENFPLGSEARSKVIFINFLLIWIIHLSGFDLRWCLVLLCKEVCTEYFCVCCLDCPFKGWHSAAIWGVGIQL